MAKVPRGVLETFFRMGLKPQWDADIWARILRQQTRALFTHRVTGKQNLLEVAMKTLSVILGHGRWIALAVAVLVCGIMVYQADATVGNKVKFTNLKGLVTDSHARPVVGATVYFIDSTTVNTTPITPPDIASGVAAAYDEPLEDIVNNTAVAKTLPQAKTNKKGQFSVRKLNSATTYFAFVVPAATDTNYLPGGDASRIAFKPTAVARKTGLTIQVSWATPSGATYIGSTACYVCHGPGGAADISSNKKHAHSLMFMRPLQPSANQDPSAHAGWLDLANKFTPATDYKTPRTGTTVETLWFQEFNNSQSNKFVISETKGNNVDPTTGKAGDVWLKAYLWTTATATTNGNFYVTLENVNNPTDPNNFLQLQVPLTMGGYIRQRLLVTPPGLKGLYQFITYQAITGSASQGSVSYYDRTRKAFVEGGSGGGGLTNFYTYNSAKKQISLHVPPAGTETVMGCATCHIGAGDYQPFPDPTTGETMAHTVGDPNGFDSGGDGQTQDIGITCEQCHGPGSQHRAEALKGVNPPPPATKGKKQTVVDYTAKFIVNPGLLCADRASVVCGRCHDGGEVTNSENFPPVGISRAQYLTYVTGPLNSRHTRYPDNLHDRGGHEGVAYEDYLCAQHSHNQRQLVACDDCHDAMGDSAYRYFLKGDPDDPNSPLCQRCHAIDINTHTVEKTGNVMSGSMMACRNCHMTRTGRGGAGRPGLILGTPTGLSSDANITYWQGDQSSHVMDVPHKFSPGVAGVQPGLAMPVPYTNACGTCHDASKLQFQAPSN